MRILVTGAAGFAGQHLLSHLEQHGHVTLPVEAPRCVKPGMRAADIGDAKALSAVVAELRPEACIHLAALAFIPRVWEEPAPAFATNVVGTMNLLTALHDTSPTCRVLVVSSSQVYGDRENGERVTEDYPMAPANLYAVSKMAADLAALSFGEHHGMPVMTARPTNHIGPGQSPDYVASAFALQIARIAKGLAPPEIRIGNLESRRSFLDVRDVVRAYRLLIEQGRHGQAYNIASPEMYRIGEVLDVLCDLAGIHPRPVRDPALYRPTDTSLALATSRIREDMGWTPEIQLRQTLRDVLDDAMKKTSET